MTSVVLFYYSSILRSSCLNDAKIITIIGYSYADEYVNVILSQALNSRSELRIINVAPLCGKEETQIEFICRRLNLKNKEQLINIDKTAKDFLSNVMNKEFFEGYIAEPRIPF